MRILIIYNIPFEDRNVKRFLNISLLYNIVNILYYTYIQDKNLYQIETNISKILSNWNNKTIEYVRLLGVA